MPEVTVILFSKRQVQPVLVVADIDNHKTLRLKGAFGNNGVYGLELAHIANVLHSDGATTAVFQTVAFDNGLARTPDEMLSLPPPFAKHLVFGMAALMYVQANGTVRDFTHAQLDQLMGHAAAKRDAQPPRSTSNPIEMKQRPQSLGNLLREITREAAAAGVDMPASFKSTDSRGVGDADDEHFEELDTSSSEEEDDAHVVDSEVDDYTDGEGGSDSDGEDLEGDRPELPQVYGSVKRRFD